MKPLRWSLLALAAGGAVLLSTAHAAGFAPLGVGLGGSYALSADPPRHWSEWFMVTSGILFAVGGLALAFFK